jgi:hypothetical protein
MREVLQQRRDGGSMVGACLGCTTRVVKVVAMDETWCDESMYKSLGEVKRVV